MKLLLNFLTLSSLMVLLSGNPTTNPSIETPKVRLGTARLTGTIISATENAKKNVSLEIFVSHPISGETVTHKVETDPAGKFAINIDVETDVTMIALKTSLNSEKPLLIDVVSEHITNIDITYNANAEITAIKTYPEMNKNDVIESLPALYRVVGIYDDKPEPQTQLYDKSPDAHLSFIKTTVADKLKMINQDSSISKERKDILTRDLRIWNYRVRAFYYERSMRANFRHFAKDTSTIPKIHKIDRSYFNYMKDLDLNNPKYLVCPSFMDFQKEVLKNDTLAIPEIAETDISSWLKSVKEILSPAVGFSDGQYYDILVANAYGMQLVDGAKPLSQKQKNNISSYWKDGEIAKILLRKNEQLVKRLKQP